MKLAIGSTALAERKRRSYLTTDLKSNAMLWAPSDGAPEHVEQVRRSAAELIGLPMQTELRPILTVGIIGAGTMGSGIAMNFLSAGFPVRMVDTGTEALERGATTIRHDYDRSASKGKITPSQAQQAFNLLSRPTNLEALASCDLIIEAAYEDMSVKLEIFSRLGKLAKESAILASNTSFLNIDKIADASGRPEDVLGTHFFSPANIMRLVEVVRGAKTSLETLATTMDLMNRLGKVPVVSGVCHGFIGNRILMQRQEQAIALLLEGASPEEIDSIHKDFGMPMGPFEMADLAGLDIGWHRDPSRIESITDAFCAQGRLGQKTSAGYYDYIVPRKAIPSIIANKILSDFRVRSGSNSRSVGKEEITVRTLYTMVNEAAHILEEGIAQRASDIDAVWIFGFGWPAATGGLLFWAKNLGFQKIVEGLERYRSNLPASFNISSLLRACANTGTGLERS